MGKSGGTYDGEEAGLSVIEYVGVGAGEGEGSERDDSGSLLGDWMVVLLGNTRNSGRGGDWVARDVQRAAWKSSQAAVLEMNAEHGSWTTRWPNGPPLKSAHPWIVSCL